MESYLWTMLVLYSLAIVTSFGRMTAGNYPRIERKSAGSDAFMFLWSLAFGVWVATLLF